jgi:small subunit ribosomal protein S2
MSVDEQRAARKEYYDNLEKNTRKAEIDSAKKLLHMRSVRKQAMADLGSTQTRDNSYRPHHDRLNPISARELTVSHLLAATAHVGHAKSSLTKASAPFVYGTRHGQAIIDVEKYTLPALRLACKVVKDTVYRDGVVVFLGTGEGTEAAIIAAAKRLGKNGFHVAGTRWLPGTLSNASRVLARAILANVDEYEAHLEAEAPQRENERRGKGDREGRQPNIDKAAFDPANIASQRLKPDLIVVMNPKSNLYAINEATQAGVPTIGVIDTDVDPRLVTYAIPANDESIRTAELIVGLLSKAGEEGAQARRKWDDELDKEQRRKAMQSRQFGTSDVQQSTTTSSADV